MIVALQHLDCLVSGDGCQLDHIGLLLGQSTRRGVPEVMEAQISNASALACSHEAVIHSHERNGEHVTVPVVR